MITHDVDTLFSVCDRVAVLVNKGIIVDTLDELVKHPDPWIQQYFGDPRAVRARQAARHARPDGGMQPIVTGD
jgi:phospholipid/cholesterol/gamma-HCH transport system ATP-binding protein